MSRPGYSAQLSSIEQALLRPHRNTSRATGHTAAAEAHKDPVSSRIKRHSAIALYEDRKGRCRIGSDRRRHTAGRRR